MREAKRRAVSPAGNGHTGYLIKQRRIRVVRSAKLQNVEAERVVMLMLGDQEPELAIAFNAAEARTFAAALIQHAEALERDAPRIIIPGANVRLPPAPQPPKTP